MCDWVSHHSWLARHTAHGGSPPPPCPTSIYTPNVAGTHPCYRLQAHKTTQFIGETPLLRVDAPCSSLVLSSAVNWLVAQCSPVDAPGLPSHLFLCPSIVHAPLNGVSGEPPVDAPGLLSDLLLCPTCLFPRVVSEDPAENDVMMRGRVGSWHAPLNGVSDEPPVDAPGLLSDLLLCPTYLFSRAVSDDPAENVTMRGRVGSWYAPLNGVSDEPPVDAPGLLSDLLVCPTCLFPRAVRTIRQKTMSRCEDV